MDYDKLVAGTCYYFPSANKLAQSLSKPNMENLFIQSFQCVNVYNVTFEYIEFQARQKLFLQGQGVASCGSILWRIYFMNWRN